jgi:hypothetical protein
MAPLVRAAGGDENVPKDKLSIINAVKLARELCWTAELHSLPERDRQLPQFYSLIEAIDDPVRESCHSWVEELIRPTKSIVVVPADQTADSADDEAAETRAAPPVEYATVDLALSASLSVDAAAEEAPLEVYRVHSAVASVVKARADGDPNYESKLRSFVSWQQRANILNAMWRGIFAVSEAWPMRKVPALLLREALGCHVDSFSIRDMASRIEAHISEETNAALGGLLRGITAAFRRTEESCSRVRAGAADVARSNESNGSHSSSRSQLGPEEAQSYVDLVCHVTDCIHSFQLLDAQLGHLETAIYSSKRGRLLPDGRYYLLSTVFHDDTVVFRVFSVKSEYDVKATGNIEVSVVYMIAVESVD